MAQKFQVMTLVQNPENLHIPDVTLAERASELLGRKVQAQSITDYRKQFGLPSVKKPAGAELNNRLLHADEPVARQEKYIKVLIEQLQVHNVPVPDME
jgi:hypothetical protein